MTEKILQHLKLKRSPPTVQYLQELITAYCSIVPWESISKILWKTNNNTASSRSADEFWTSAFQYGTVGTCYESNWAFYCLLQDLGFTGYLTINKVMDKTGLHTAIVILLNGNKYIVDIGYPAYAPIPVDEEAVTVFHTPVMNYRCTPVSSNEYIIENFPHPKPYLYHLTDIPVHPGDYLEMATRDYSDGGLFSGRIIIRKLINNLPTRFDSEDLPYNIHTLHNGEKQKTYIKKGELGDRLSDHFNLDGNLINQAFMLLNKTKYECGIANVQAELQPLGCTNSN